MTQAIANANRDRKKKRRPYKLDDFLLKWAKQRQDPLEQLSTLKQFVTSLGGTIRHRDQED